MGAEVALAGALLLPLQAWRARSGEILTVSDPQGDCYRARVVRIDAAAAVLVPFTVCPAFESPLRIEVYQAIPDKERFELVLQKLTELGATRIVPFTCQRSTTREARDARQKKSHRWPEVVWRAARQCRRELLPELWEPLTWNDCLQEAASADLALLLYEGEGCLPLRTALQNFSGHRVALLIGPEGGFTAEEVTQARQSGSLPVALGPRILRTETAAISALTVVQYELGDLGRR